MIENTESPIFRPDPNTFGRFNEVIDQLVQSSNMLEFGDGEYELWCQELLFECRMLKENEYRLKHPRHPKGLIRHLKKCLCDLHKVRVNFLNLPDPFIRQTLWNGFNLDYLNLEPGNENKFSGYGISPHELLSHAAVALSMTIAEAVREGKKSRARAPKTLFADQMIYLFQRANSENEVTSSPTSEFAEFFSLAYYVAEGEVGTFLETPVKAAIRALKEFDGYILHPNFLRRDVPDEILSDIEYLWPGLLESRKKAMNATETEQEFSNSLGRDQVADARWVIENLHQTNNSELLTIHNIIRSGLRQIGNRTASEQSALDEYEKFRMPTSAK